MQPIRVLGFTSKDAENASPNIRGPYQVTLDLEGSARLYLRFWETGFLRRKQTQAATQAGLEALAQDYHLNARPEPLEPFNPSHTYAAVYSDQGFEDAAVSLLQIGCRARLHTHIEPHSGLCSFTIGTNRDLGAFLSTYFRDLQPITTRTFQKAAQGRRLKPRTLTKLTLPTLPGVEEADPLPVPLHPPDDTQGGLCIGDVLSPLTRQPIHTLNLPVERLNRQTLVAGTTGAGKTNTVLNLLHQTHDNVDGILVFDVKKEYRCLHDTLDAKVYGFQEGFRLTHNLLKPVGPPTRWIKQFASIFSEVISRNVPASGSKDVLAEELDNLYAERGVYDGSRNYPHIGNLLERLEARAHNTLASREKGWIASARRVLKSLTIGETKHAFCVKQGLALNRLLEGVNVVELDGIGDPAAEALLISILLQKTRNRRMTKLEPSDLSLLVVVEEAQNILAKDREATSVIATTCREIRSLGVGMIYVTQMPSRFSANAIANVNTIIAHKLVHPQDKRFTADILGLQRSQADLIEDFSVGTALVKTDTLSLASVPEVDRPSVQDDTLEPHTSTRQEVASSFAQRVDVENRLMGLNPRELAVFMNVADADAIYHSALQKALGYGGQEVSGILRKLVQKGLLGFRKAKKNSSPRARTLYFLRTQGYEAYRQRRDSYPDRKPRKGSGHTEAQAIVVQTLGVENRPHPRFDILFEREDGEEIAMEVETGSNNDEQLRENLVKSLEFQQRAFFTASNRTVYNRILQTAARYAFDQRHPFTLHIALINELGPVEEWDYFDFE